MDNQNQNNNPFKPVPPPQVPSQAPRPVSQTPVTIPVSAVTSTPVTPVPTPTPPPSPPSPNLPPPPAAPPPPPPLIPIKKSPFRYLIPVLAAGIVILLVVLIAQKVTKSKSGTPTPSGTSTTKTTTINYWGLWEPAEVMQPLIAKFESQNPGIKVNYQQQSIQDYRERLQNALNNNQGPDVFRYHLTWTPLLASQLSAIPSTIMSSKDFEAQAYPVTQAWLKSSKGYLGLPMMYEGLALLYNQSVFEAAGKNPPSTWEELRRLAIELTVKGKQGDIQRGGIALGTTTNVDNWSDILGLLLLQNGANPVKPNNQLGKDALTFYTLFTKTDKVWNDAMPSSTVAFATEKVAMIIVPSWRVLEVKNMNPALKFGIAPLPQLPDTEIAWASIWVDGVSTKTDKAKQTAAWQFLAFMNQKENLRDWYATASKQRLFGELFARTDMADQLKTDPYAGPYITQAPYARSWFLSSRTFDNGPNDKIIKYYEDAVNAINNGNTAATVLETVEQGVSQVVNQYNLPSSVPVSR